MNIKRAFLVLAAVLLTPGLAMAGLSAVATFSVDLTFDPVGPTGTVNLDCTDTITDAHQEQSGIKSGNEAQFDILFLPNADTECTVTVDLVPGYAESYSASGDPTGSTTPGVSCDFTNIADGENFICGVALVAPDVNYEIDKFWSGVNLENVDYTLEITCSPQGSISSCSSGAEGGSFPGCVDTAAAAFCGDGVGDCDFVEWDFSGTDFESVDVNVAVNSTCKAFEFVDQSNVESSLSSECSAQFMQPGDNKDCTITNTTFFEGIPTLNQYGLAILALLMLGVGFVGFRRFV